VVVSVSMQEHKEVFFYLSRSKGPTVKTWSEGKLSRLARLILILTVFRRMFVTKT
jgi:hypothetical protein